MMTVLASSMPFSTGISLLRSRKIEDVNLLGTGYEDWLKSIERVGTLGVYSKDVIDDLDSITGCNEHKELGTSEDGNYKYYLSINKDAESDLTDEIEKIETTNHRNDSF